MMQNREPGAPSGFARKAAVSIACFGVILPVGVLSYEAIVQQQADQLDYALAAMAAGSLKYLTGVNVGDLLSRKKEGA